MLYTLSSSLHHESLNLPFELDEQWVQANQVVAVLTGGSEEQFLQLLHTAEGRSFEPWRDKNFQLKKNANHSFIDGSSDDAASGCRGLGSVAQFGQ